MEADQAFAERSLALHLKQDGSDEDASDSDDLDSFLEELKEGTEKLADPQTVLDAAKGENWHRVAALLAASPEGAKEKDSDVMHHLPLHYALGAEGTSKAPLEGYNTITL